MSTQTINGYLISQDKQQPLAGLRVEAWDKSLSVTVPLGTAISNTQGYFSISPDTQYTDQFSTGRIQDVFFKIYKDNRLLLDTRDKILWNAAKPTDVRIPVPVDNIPPVTPPVYYTVSGKVVTDKGAPVSRVIALAKDKRLPYDIPLSSAVTDAGGNYRITYDTSLLKGKPQPDLEVSVMNESSREIVIGKSDIRYNAGSAETINVILHSAQVPVTSEYDRLTGDLQPNLGGIALKDLQENQNNSHITLLSNKTGWDARAVAMAAQANKLNAVTGIPPVHYYALFRAGLPANDEVLSRLPSATVEKIITHAADTKIIPPNTDIQSTLKILNTRSVDFLLHNSAAVGVSSLGNMLNIRLNTDQQNIFAESYKEAAGNNDLLWSSLKSKGIPPETISQLQLDGKLGYLTSQNAPLIKRLYEAYQVSDPVQLVHKGLYKAAAWKNLVGNDVPQGVNPDSYAANMANQLALSYPTAVVSEMVNNNEVMLNNNAPKDVVSQFFSTAGQENVLGVKPVKQWESFGQLHPEAQVAAKQVERIFQLSPSNESLSTLSKLGLNSAYEITKYSQSEFLEKYGSQFPSTAEAMLTHTKAQEIYSTVTNIATTYITGRTTPNVYALTGKTTAETQGSPAPSAGPMPKGMPQIIGYPTLDKLFGNMDYCSCDECKSVLGPAAYLVDLLQFIDLAAIPHTKKNPLDVLLERRPDIQHLQLTCENTNTALPYIDLVNEILEYYIVNGSLTGFAGHDIKEGTNTADLMADPQFVLAKAYEKTNSEVFPYNLPFDQPRESLRLFFSAWSATLEDALRVFGSELPAQKERLGLNLKEYDILTKISAHQLPEYFGESSATNIDGLNAAVASGKVFSRRVDITYEDLVNLLKTQFINPGTLLVPNLDQLQIRLDQIQAYYDGTLSDTDLNNLLPPALDTSTYGGNVGQWLKNNHTLIKTLILLTEITPDTGDCNMATMELRYALPDMIQNKLDEIAYHKLHRFIRLWKKTSWKIQTIDQVIIALLPVASKDLTLINIDQAFVVLLARLANFNRLINAWKISEQNIPDVLLLWNNSLAADVKQTQCAKLFRMSVGSLSDLAKITGADPLTMDLEADYPAILKYYQVTQDLKAASLKVSDLAYLLMHKDPAGKLTPDETTLLKNIKALRDALNTVDKENNVAPDNADLSFAKTKMALVYDNSVVDTFFSLLTNSKIYSAPLLLPEESLPSPLTVDAQLGYDAFKKRLNYTGILTPAAQTILDNKADALTLADMTLITQQPALDSFKTQFKQALQAIKSAADADLAALAAGYPELKAVYNAVLAQPTPAQKTTVLINSILPTLIIRLKENALLQALVPVTQSDIDTISTLATNPAIIHSVSDNTKNVLNDFTLLQTAVTFNHNQVYDGYLDPPASDDYILYVKAPAGTTVTLNINNKDIITAANIGVAGEVQSALPVTLQTGVLTEIKLTITALPLNGVATIWWRTKGMAKVQVPGSNYYIQSQVDHAKTALLRLSKAVQLKKQLTLTTPETAYFAALNSETKNLFNELPTTTVISDPDLHTLWQKINLLLFFTLLKKTTEQDENTWLQILITPTVKTPQGNGLLTELNNWQQTDVDAVLLHMGKTWNDLSKLSVLKKVVEAMQLVTTINYPAATVISWSVDNPDQPLISGIKTMISSRTDHATWLTTLQSVNDVLRNRQRDALVSYILHRQQPSPEIDTPDKLYEYFLIDVQMDACMKTSRIRQALSTIQLFIYRCLINLEVDVAPSSIRAQQWEWMQRYRVWEANRKIFLYPENWLDPTLRDGKSSFYQELEGELMQTDINNDLAETAFLNYLKKLDDVARLEIVGMYLQENVQGNPNDNIMHVFGRTNGSTRQYYYRRYEYGYWTAWEKISMHIEGDNIFPVIWKDRLFVFWLNAVEKAKEENRDQHPRDMADHNWGESVKKDVEINFCWGEYYKGKWTSPKSSELKEPVVIKDLLSFDARNILLYARKVQKDINTTEHLIFYFFYLGSEKEQYTFKSVTFTSKNSPPIIENIDIFDNNASKVALFNYELYRKAYEGSNPSVLNATSLKMFSQQLQLLIDQPAFAAQDTVTETVLTKSSGMFQGFRLLPLRHEVQNQWQAPFVYHDEQSVFFVQPNEQDIAPIWVYTGYYDMGNYSMANYKVNILPPVERPVLTVPVKRGDPLQPVMDVSSWQQAITTANSNYNIVLPAAGNFSFDQATFGIGGKVPGLQNITQLTNISNH
ncbi:virulence plasmid A protein [Chitinophaga niastensis]|uniref:Virulence plasmid A protein n=1 Tax=Chitinophaga niastensis TaxID=536980 RepID=A0A2P8HGQ9_CHINA|nr:neuraminidase-like domain-containing protein [Chitinophaga niastensis]PSL45405.1 virulence plasmid A protein [Chitinophaga niastensis]